MAKPKLWRKKTNFSSFFVPNQNIMVVSGSAAKLLIFETKKCNVFKFLFRMIKA